MYLAVKKEHLNKYDVIHLDIQWCMEPAGGPEQVVSYISEKTIAELKHYLYIRSNQFYLRKFLNSKQPEMHDYLDLQIFPFSRPFTVSYKIVCVYSFLI